MVGQGKAWLGKAGILIQHLAGQGTVGQGRAGQDKAGI